MMDEIEEIVLEALKNANEPMRPGQVAEAASLQKDEVSKIIQRLKKQGRVSSPKRCFWEPA